MEARASRLHCGVRALVGTSERRVPTSNLVPNRGPGAILTSNSGGRSAGDPQLAPTCNLLPPDSKYGPLVSGQ